MTMFAAIALGAAGLLAAEAVFIVWIIAWIWFGGPISGTIALIVASSGWAYDKGVILCRTIHSSARKPPH